MDKGTEHSTNVEIVRNKKTSECDTRGWEGGGRNDSMRTDRNMMR